MVRPSRLLNPWFLVTLVAFLGGALGLGIVHGSVVACTVGFDTSGAQPMGATPASGCEAEAFTAAVLLMVDLVTGAGLFWFVFKWRSQGQTDHMRQAEVGTDEGEGNRTPSPRVWSRWLTSASYGWVCVLVAVFVGATFFANGWGYFQLGGPAGGIYDLSVNQQSLSSTLLGGKPYVFYEAINCGRHGQCSFLQVHPSFVGFPVAALYGVAPTAFTLFALQSLAMGLGALPLYALSVDVIGSRRLSLVVAAAYLAWLPAFMATSFSFHWESFIPVEMLTLFWLWNRQRYLLAAPVVVLAFLTIEVTPVLTFFVALYFLWPWLLRTARLLFHALAGGGPTGTVSKLRLWARWVRMSLRLPAVYACFLLMAGSVVAYVLLRLFVLDGGWLLGLPPIPPAYALPLNTPNKDFAFSFATLSTQWMPKLAFWLVIFATLGLVPFFAPRALLLVLPWIVFAVFNTNPAYWILGNHYIFPATAPLFLGFLYGLDRLYRWIAPGSPGSASRSASNPTHRPRTSPVRPWTLDGRPAPGAGNTAAILSLGVMVIIAGNLVLNPFNPYAPSLSRDLGKPFPGTYGVNLGSFPNDTALQQLISIVPKNAIVTAPLPVYSLVADDPYAYPMAEFSPPVYNDSLLPDNISARVQYVVVPTNTPNGDFPASLLANLYDRATFGVRGCVSNSAVGAVELFQRAYSGDPQVFGPPGPLCPNYYVGGAGLTSGPSSNSSADLSSPSGVVVQSSPCPVNETVWTGPGIALPAGEYGFHFVFTAFNASGAACQRTTIDSSRGLLVLNVTGQDAAGGGPAQFYHHKFSEGSVEHAVCTPSCNGWLFWNVTVTLPSATIDLSTIGTVLIGQYVVQIAYLVVTSGPNTN